MRNIKKDMNQLYYVPFLFCFLLSSYCGAQSETPIQTAGQPGILEITKAGQKSVRIILRPANYETYSFVHPVLSQKEYPSPGLSLRNISKTIKKSFGELEVEIKPAPLTITVKHEDGFLLQELVFKENGEIFFKKEESPILGLGEGGPDSPVNSAIPEPKEEWDKQEVEFDRNGRFLEMEPRPQGGAYGSRNPVPLLVGTEGWALFFLTPWVPEISFDLTHKERGIMIPKEPKHKPSTGNETSQAAPGVIDLFVFDVRDPLQFMKELSEITGPSVLPPKWALGYMQSHRSLEDDSQMVEIIRTFRSKGIPLDAVVYLGSGFVQKGWSKPQPSFEFNPEVFKQSPGEVISRIHDENAKIALHIWPWDEDKLPKLHGSIPPKPGEIIDSTHILNYWRFHEDLIGVGVDGFWPDSGDRFDFFSRFKRHQMYYQGPLSSRPGVRPWSLHRNGYLGVAKWGGWIWSGDIISSWKTLEAQIAVGINHSLSLSPFWGSDIGGFFPNEQLTGELYARWIQFGAFCPSFRSHGKTWWTRLPWGWGLDEMGPLEGDGREPLQSELNNPSIEPVVKKYIELRYRLMPYTYTLTWEARDQGMPLMRAMWLHYPDDENARDLGDQYLWGADLLIAPIYEKNTTSREVYLPKGNWFDFWTNKRYPGGQIINKKVDLETMPIFVRAGAIIPFDPIRQYTSQPTDEPTTIRIYPGANGEYILYEDDGQTLDYLNDEFYRTKFKWDDDERSLTIEPFEQSNVNRVQTRSFRIELNTKEVRKLVNYTGEQLQVFF